MRPMVLFRHPEHRTQALCIQHPVDPRIELGEVGPTDPRLDGRGQRTKTTLKQAGQRHRLSLGNPARLTFGYQFFHDVSQDTLLLSGGLCGATLLVNMRDIEPRKEDDGFDGAFLSP